MKKIFATIFAVLFVLTSGLATAAVDKEGEGWYQRWKTNGGIEYQYFKNGHPDNQSEWAYCGQSKEECQGTPPPPPPEPKPCVGCGKGSYNFKVFAIDGGLDVGSFHGVDGAAIAGGFAGGGGFGFVLGKGTTAGALTVTGGGMAKVSEINELVDGIALKGTLSEAWGVTGLDGWTKLNGFGLSVVGGFGAVSEATSAKGGITLPGNVYGITGGEACQYGKGVIEGASFGNGAFEGQISMYGKSYVANWSDVKTVDGFTTTSLGTVVGSSTTVETFGSEVGNGNISGKFEFAGHAGAATALEGANGGAAAMTEGTYSGKGTLGCNIEGSAEGFTGTSSVTRTGWNGAINSATAGMTVKINSGSKQPN